MFPVPQHLPRTGGEHLTSSTTDNDPVLDLLQPLIPSGEGSASFNGPQVKSVRESLERAVGENKSKTHDLLNSNFPSISSQIQLSTELRTNVAGVEMRLSNLEKEIDHTDASTSFLPPLLTTLNRHYTASTSRSAAQSHIKSLKALSSHAERLRKLEQAVWAGQGADDWVVEELTKEGGYELDQDVRDGEEILRGTKIRRAIEAKDGLLRSMVVEQIIEGFHSAVSVSTPTNTQSGIVLSVQANVTLQHPKSSRPSHLSPTAASPYPLSDIYGALSRLHLLQPELSKLSSRLLKDLIQAVISGRRRVVLSTTASLSILRLESASDQSSSKVLDGVRTVLDFTASSVFPSSSISEREPFLDAINTSAFRLILNDLILPSMPSSLSDIHGWLEALSNAATVESGFSPISPVIKPFFESEAGLTWAQQRRYAVSDEVRRLILSGWGGWEGSQKEKERETIVYVEVEIDEPESPPLSQSSDADGMEKDDADFGWGFEGKQSPEKTTQHAELPSNPTQEEDMVKEDDGWGFDESASTVPTAVAGPSNPMKFDTPSAPMEEDGDGWDLDPSPPSSAKPASPTITPTEPLPVIKTAKPAREAKRLGKKVAKVKAEDDYDPWGSGTDSAVDDIVSTSSGERQNGQPSSSTRASPPPPATSTHKLPAQLDQADDGWGWEDDTPAAPAVTARQVSSTPAQPKQKRKELKEERRVVREKYLVSVACETLVSIAKSVIADISELEETLSISPSFASTALEPVLLEAVKEVFTLYRALLPTHYAKQLLDVPSLAMQAYNDTNHLSASIPSQLDSQSSPLSLSDESEKLLALGEYLFESQLENQRASLMENLGELDGLQGVADEKVFHRAERGLKGVVYDLESLGRVIKPVLAQTKSFEILSYLTTTLISHLTTAVLDLGDITEIESNRLTELFRVIYPLETLFSTNGSEHTGRVAGEAGEGASDGGVVLHVPGWLKFCYISEILQASLVDITYLLDSGSLIDFTPSELVGLVRALFASSDKRDAVVDRIERDGLGGAGTGAGEEGILVN